MPFNFKYAEGSCYILDRDSVQKIVKYERDNNIPCIIQEDITVGYIAHLLGIQTTDYTIPLQWYGNTHFSFHPCRERKSSCSHGIDDLCPQLQHV
jgi:hypothetical protein